MSCKKYISFIFFISALHPIIHCRSALIQNSELENACHEKLTDFESRFELQFSKIRVKAGAGKPVRDSALARSAENFARILAERENLNYNSNERPLIRLSSAGNIRESVAENLAKIPFELNQLEELLYKWKKGQIEYSNIINPKYHYFGIGRAKSQKDCYYVLILTD